MALGPFYSALLRVFSPNVLEYAAMSRKVCRLLPLACICLAAISAASGESPSELVGMWDYSSLTAIRNGSPFGTVHFKPGQWTVRFNADGTYVTKGPLKSQSADSEGATGKYEIHKHSLTMRPDKSGHELRYDFKLREDGKLLVLTDKDKGTIIEANRE